MKLGQKIYNRGLGHGVITEITDEYYTIKYDKILVQYPHKDITSTMVVICLLLAFMFLGTFIYFAL